MTQDHFERYFAEKLWEMIPAVYRNEDGKTDHPGVLHAIVETIAQQAAGLRRSQDRLWDDQFIELCDDWAVPYIADLLGTRMVSAKNKRGRRADVAKTIYYRRRKGTPRVLEELISDISDWEGKMVESFQRIVRSRHGLDPIPDNLTGRFSGTMPGGVANLRMPVASEMAGGPFDEFFHTPDMRQHTGNQGRYNIPKLAFHLYRLNVYEVREATPFSLEDNKNFGFDPSGRRIPLFMPRNRPDDWEKWYSALEWELPGPIRRRLLGHCIYEISESVVQRLVSEHGLTQNAADKLRFFCNWQFQDEDQLSAAMSQIPEINVSDIFLPLLRYSIIAKCGKNSLLPSAIKIDTGYPNFVIPPEQIVAGNLESRTPWLVPIKRLVIDPENGRFNLIEQDASKEINVTYFYGFSGPIGAGTYNRSVVLGDHGVEGGGKLDAAKINNNGITHIKDSKTYGPVGSKDKVENLSLIAANEQRPYLRLENNWILKGAIEDAKLNLEGIWVGSKGPYGIIMRGDYEQVTIRNCTLDPGCDTDLSGHVINPVPLIIEGYVEQLIIESSITGAIQTGEDGYVEQIIIRDSIVQNAQGLAISGNQAKLERVTILGSIQVSRLQASEALITGRVVVADIQNSCFRFSAAPNTSVMPRPYESFLFAEDTQHWFNSCRFGHPGYGQLSETAPAELQRGAENGSEIGAFNNLNNPLKLDSLRSKIEEYMPFGLIPIFINET